MDSLPQLFAAWLQWQFSDIIYELSSDTSSHKWLHCSVTATGYLRTLPAARAAAAEPEQVAKQLILLFQLTIHIHFYVPLTPPNRDRLNLLRGNTCTYK